MSSPLTLEDRQAARAMFDEGSSLGEIAEALNCSVSALSPWLYRAAALTPDTRVVRPYNVTAAAPYGGTLLEVDDAIATVEWDDGTVSQVPVDDLDRA